MTIEVVNGVQVHTASLDGQLFAEVQPNVFIKAKYANGISLFKYLPVALVQSVSDEHGNLEVVLAPMGITIPTVSDLEDILKYHPTLDNARTSCCIYRLGDTYMLLLTSIDQKRFIACRGVDCNGTCAYFTYVSEKEAVELHLGASIDGCWVLSDLLPLHIFPLSNSVSTTIGDLKKLSLDSQSDPNAIRG